MQHDDLWLRGVAADESCGRGVERRKCKDGVRHHWTDGTSGGIGKMEDIRSGKVDTGSAASVAGPHPAARPPPPDKTCSIRDVHRAPSWRPTYRRPDVWILERAVHLRLRSRILESQSAANATTASAGDPRAGVRGRRVGTIHNKHIGGVFFEMGRVGSAQLQWRRCTTANFSAGVRSHDAAYQSPTQRTQSADALCVMRCRCEAHCYAASWLRTPA